MKPSPKEMTLDEYIAAREAMGEKRRQQTPLSYGIHSADAIIKRYNKYESEYQAATPVTGEKGKTMHTPGPWHYKPTTLGHPDNRINPIITTDFDGIGQAHYIARVGWAGSTIPGMTSLTPATFEEAEANARLIAAAPKLLEALEGEHGALGCKSDAVDSHPCHTCTLTREARGE